MQHFRPQLQRTLRRLGRTLLALYLLAIIGGLIADQYVQFRQSDAETQQFFANRQQPILHRLLQHPAKDRCGTSIPKMMPANL
jgi:hypothetical protein